MDKATQYNLIEKYLDHQLVGEELQQFEARLQSDPALRKEVALHQQLAETLASEKLHQLRNVLQSTDQTFELPTKNEAKHRRLGPRFWLTVAAAVSLLVMTYILWIPAPLSPSELYAAHFEPYPMLLNQRSDRSQIDQTPLLLQAISSYDNGQYAAAQQAFQSLYQAESDKPSYQFYLATSALANDDPVVAIPLLRQLATANNHNFLEQSQWYLSLAYLQANDLSAARAALQAIAAGTFQYRSAQELLDQLGE